MTSRRTFLIGGVGAVALSAGTYAWLRARGYEIDPPIDLKGDARAATAGLSGPPYDPRALANLPLLLNVLLPGDPAHGVPSAVEAGVVDYIVAASRQPGMKAVRAEVLKLCRFLDRKAQSRAGYRFSELESAEDRAQVVEDTATDGRARGRFRPAVALEMTLRLALEGYLGHPHHGGNKDARVWDQLGIVMPKDRNPQHNHG